MQRRHATSPGRSARHQAPTRRALLASLLALVLLLPTGLQADDAQDLRDLLDEFLHRVDDPEMHERFWDDALIYTSSNGTRFGKKAILAGLSDGASDATAAPIVTYWAERTEVMLFGDTAVVAFLLRSEAVPGPGEAAAQASYLNTGTFHRRDGAWRAVAWQATRIPEAAAPPIGAADRPER